MNPQIFELAEQAGMNSFNRRSDGFYVVDEKVFQRFAELVIMECVNIACEYDRPKLSGPGLAIASNIESHFDVYITEDGRFVK